MTSCSNVRNEDEREELRRFRKYVERKGTVNTEKSSKRTEEENGGTGRGKEEEISGI